MVSLNILERISKAESFVANQKRSDGLWSDFESRQHGKSVDWISAYTGISLLNTGINKSGLEETAKQLLQRQLKNGGWGYNNDSGPPDADSTAFTIIFLSKLEKYDKEISNAISFLSSHQKDSGGFSTYKDEESLNQHYKGRIQPGTSFKGWCSEIPEITAIACQAIDNNEAVEYLKKTQNPDGSWHSYWYNSDIYATHQALTTLKMRRKENVKAKQWIARQETKNPFYLALIIKSLADNKQYFGQISSHITLLEKLQQNDGSWDSPPILRVPKFSNINPWEDNSRWRPDLNDQNKVFTTATCMEALFLYNKRAQ